MELQDRVAIVTGATSGIGEAIARRFMQEGAKVALVGHSDDQGRKVETELRRLGAGECFYVHADVSDSAQVRAAVAAVTQRWQRVDVLVNNAAVMKGVRLVDMDEADWDLTLSVNLKGPFLFAKYTLPAMPHGGAIVNISSVHAVATDVATSAYSASKGGLEALTRALALECYRMHIRVNALRVGAVDTGMLWNNPRIMSGKEKVDPRDVAQPVEIAEAALFLASQRSRFVSGAVLTIDGGRLPILGSHAP
ncbi:SDR family NAD(P)-dependent oxidoreductase [Pseudoduganella sp. GCM10020061]|uniref:SDR family NAD(P)-dependent oxidoreductase n=1 Tax=Pseudoduganella sp. GCM10020061 TaxID=3317345 RepID=UPI00362B54DD